MSNNCNKKSKKKVNFTRILLIGVLIYFVCVFCIQQFRINEYKVQEKYYAESISEINQEIEEYEMLKESSNTSEYIEKIAREKLGLVKPYEKIFVDVNK